MARPGPRGEGPLVVPLLPEDRAEGDHGEDHYSHIVNVSAVHVSAMPPTVGWREKAAPLARSGLVVRAHS